MHPIDLTIFAIYIIGLLGFGYYFYRKNKGGEDYYVGGRDMNSLHIGLSVVATDVGGGFSIGLGGLGFTMGLSGSWMLFTGLLGAWSAAVLLIPKVKNNPVFKNAYTFPQIFEHHYSGSVALVAAVISAIGYAGFTSSQILAGAKLANGTFANLSLDNGILIMGIVAVVYTVLGGIKAVIYTDTIQWTILMLGLVFVGIPISYSAVGGWDTIQATVSPEMLSLTNFSWQDVVYWLVTIFPIWYIGMTLYQRIYACRDEKTAKRAWYLAGLFEWPVMAFMGVALGLFARVAADQGMFDYLGAASVSEIDPETGLPMLLRTVLPVGFMGVMLAAYFSAILSTADSCLMASSGNIVTDFLSKLNDMDHESASFLKTSQIVTFVIGALAILVAYSMDDVLTLMLYSYAFMVSGLFVPVIGALYWKRSTPAAAMTAMLLGGSVTLFLQLKVGAENLPYELDPNVFGITASALSFIAVGYWTSE
ncbi:sodium:solute symporter family protein [Gracilimonas mengyeensis]|uniref:Solute:Na+ symporter, SSS family n=1 Tax=Gracilimonas mengyeensis TaxID=1302730 RepID=A0A521DDJ6_9BACT|nr:sodium:solute symporter family protein [Gracilimonas mengyeensis]SMO69665.1 solute:Na+ symporter, SSS family [Gracilimonas mengyeensis]